MKELQIQVVLHKRKDLGWPIAETDKHWIVMDLDKDLNAAMILAARNAIKFLAVQAKISELDAYALCGIAVSFRVTGRGHRARCPRAHSEEHICQRTQATDESGVRQRPNQRRSARLNFGSACSFKIELRQLDALCRDRRFQRRTNCSCSPHLKSRPA
jgi:hypothetical protein